MKVAFLIGPLDAQYNNDSNVEDWLSRYSLQDSLYDAVPLPCRLI